MHRSYRPIRYPEFDWPEADPTAHANIQWLDKREYRPPPAREPSLAETVVAPILTVALIIIWVGLLLWGALR